MLREKILPVLFDVMYGSAMILAAATAMSLAIAIPMFMFGFVKWGICT